MFSCTRSVLRLDVSHLSRQTSTISNDYVASFCYNRNPRNLEKLRIAHRAKGYHLEKPGKNFWNKIVIKSHRSSRSITGEVVHHTGHVVVSASTNESAINKHLNSKNDKTAYVILAKVLAQRCMETGINEVSCFIEKKQNTKAEAFLLELEKEGITLEEPPEYEHPRPSDPFRPEKPWEVY